ncbi:MAG: hypothetical protein NE330_10400 [Lentisphaeraceae bacterium]|nr:hypothetical protein [Lentisphaeraceae bacterium]
MGLKSKVLLSVSFSVVLLMGTSCRKAVRMAKKARVAGKVAKKINRESNKSQDSKSVQEKEPLATYSLEHPNGYPGSTPPTQGASANTGFTSTPVHTGNTQVMTRISSKYAVKLPPHGLREFRVEHDGIEKRNIVLHYKYQGKIFTTHWVHDYFVSKGKYCFAVSDKEGKISGLLPVDLIDKGKTGGAYKEAGEFARYVKAELKSQQGL